MESVIKRQQLRYLEDQQLICDHQGQSAGDLLVYLTHNLILIVVETKAEALAVNLDLAKAFNRVCHKDILSKLPSYGLTERLCK